MSIMSALGHIRMTPSVIQASPEVTGKGHVSFITQAPWAFTAFQWKTDLCPHYNLYLQLYKRITSRHLYIINICYNFPSYHWWTWLTMNKNLIKTIFRAWIRTHDDQKVSGRLPDDLLRSNLSSSSDEDWKEWKSYGTDILVNWYFGVQV